MCLNAADKLITIRLVRVGEFAHMRGGVFTITLPLSLIDFSSDVGYANNRKFEFYMLPN